MISVLLVDDEPPSLDSGKRYLETKGHYNVSTTLSPLTALNMLKSGHYDIIISDYNMPDMDGIGFLKEVRAAYPTLPFILYTSKGRADIAGEAFDNEADFYLQRTGNPVLVMEELTQKIQLIVERRSMQDALKTSEEKFRLIFDKANDAIHVHGLTADGLPGRFIDINEVACRMLQYSKDELLQKGPLDLVTTYHSRPIPQIMEDLALHGYTRFETEHRRKDGTIVMVEVNSHSIHLLNKPVILSVVRDITERKKAEDAIHMANKKLNLLSSITRHDIKNQLMALNAYISLSEGVVDNPSELKVYFAKEQKIADAIAHQISFTKDYENLGVKAPVWQNISAIIKKVIPQLPMGNIHIDAEDSDLEVFADPLLEKVFYNLTDNALRYGGEQMTYIRVTTRDDNNNLIITVEDNGNGISADDKKQLFNRGFGKNTGLGLFLSSEILSLTGITISESGESGKGARFEMTVPKGIFQWEAGSQTQLEESDRRKDLG